MRQKWLLLLCAILGMLSVCEGRVDDAEDGEVEVEIEEEEEVVMEEVKLTDEQILAKLLRKLDKNGDGQVTKEEIKKASPKLVNQVRRMQTRINEPEMESESLIEWSTKYWIIGIVGAVITYFVWQRQARVTRGMTMEAIREARLSHLEEQYTKMKQEKEERERRKQEGKKGSQARQTNDLNTNSKNSGRKHKKR